VARLVLDSDILSYLLQRQPRVAAQFREAVKANDDILLCPVVYYQVRRGLMHKGAARQLQRFEELMLQLSWVDFERRMWGDAADLYAGSRQRGLPHSDSDLLIAAFARALGATLVTNNTSHFQHLGVSLLNWGA
jgi:tRNA(fMet)-specific endonuclease VapC